MPEPTRFGRPYRAAFVASLVAAISRRANTGYYHITRRDRQSPRQGAGARKASQRMGRVTLVLVLVVMLVALGGGLFLAFWDFHVPRTQVERVLPDARFPK
jgi:hypothetical protein